MPRNYKKKLGLEGKRNYDEKYLQEAIKKVKLGQMSIRKASEAYGVPYTTLQRWIKYGNKLLKYGRPPVLNSIEEDNLVKGLLLSAEWGFPLQSKDIRIIVKIYLDSRGVVDTRFKDNYPGEDWFSSFMRRHPILSAKLCGNIKINRAGVTEQILNIYFNNLKESLNGVALSNIFNYDETNFTDNPNAVKVIVKRGCKHPERILDTSKVSASVMIAGTPDGTILPPYIVYKAAHLYEGWTEGGIAGSAYNRSQSGWFDAVIFEDWFRTIILPHVRRLDGPKVLIGDNLSSHVSLSVVEEFTKNDIRFVLLPANSTHLCQPLDVAFEKISSNLI